MINDRQDEINQLARRRSILTRISTDRYAAPLDTPERYRLEEACKKAVVSLAESASHVLQSNALSSYSNSSVSSPDASSSSITITTDSDININSNSSSNTSFPKWRTRLTRELSSLRCSLLYLEDAKQTLYAAVTENVGTTINNNPRGKSFSIGRHCYTAASHLEKARCVCKFVRKEIPGQLSLRLQSSKRNIALEAHTAISEVHRKVREFETQVIEQLAILAAAEAEIAFSATDTNLGCYDRSTCELPHLKRALCLLMTLA